MAQSWATSARPPYGPHFQGSVYEEDTGKTVAVTYDDEGGRKATLAAAAPAMLAALESFIFENNANFMVDESRHAASKCRDRLLEIRREAREAIAKAKGGAS